MKKIIIVSVISLFSLTSFSQSYSNAIGVRGGLSNGITFKHMMGDSKGFELLLETRWQGFSFTALYEIHAQAFEVEGLNWYYGFGAHIGSWRGSNGHKYFPNDRDYTVIGIDGIVGIEYNIAEIPINISLDYKPVLNLVGHTGFWGDNGALSIRYYF